MTILRAACPFVLSLFGFAVPLAAQALEPPHLELEMTSQEYQALLKDRPKSRSADALEDLLDVGKRNIDWIEAVNASRSEAERLQLSTAETQRGYPIDAPTLSNRALIKTEWEQLLAALPPVMKAVLVDGVEAPENLPISDEIFLANVRLVDRIYQRASRWLAQEPYLFAYAARASDDVRGYYFLANTADLEATLKAWSSLATERRTQLTGWLALECVNGGVTLAACKREIETTVARNGHPYAFHTKYVADAKAHWDSYFDIPYGRDDVTWTSANASLFSIPFKDPGRDDVKAWLKDNIEDEWRWGNWRLALDFRATGGADMTHVRFEAGATPHVDGIAGSEITMDGNRNIGEYMSRWTIRHEYGHVLGFPDCYLEFYDDDAEVMISYQLDITNLMCSRRGKLQQGHYDELKRVYFQE